MTFYKALTNYIEAHYKNLELPEEYDEEIFLDHIKWQGESAWILETDHLEEVERFIEDLIENTARYRTQQDFVDDDLSNYEREQRLKDFEMNAKPDFPF